MSSCGGALLLHRAPHPQHRARSPAAEHHAAPPHLQSSHGPRGVAPRHPSTRAAATTYSLARQLTVRLVRGRVLSVARPRGHPSLRTSAFYPASPVRTAQPPRAMPYGTATARTAGRFFYIEHRTHNIERVAPLPRHHSAPPLLQSSHGLRGVAPRHPQPEPPPRRGSATTLHHSRRADVFPRTSADEAAPSTRVWSSRVPTWTSSARSPCRQTAPSFSILRAKRPSALRSRPHGGGRRDEASTPSEVADDRRAAVQAALFSLRRAMRSGGPAFDHECSLV